MASQYIVHTVGVGDTIQSIGLLYDVDWTELAIVNGLEYPYIDDSIELNEYANVDTVAKVGSKLVIPTKGLNIPKKTNNIADEIEKYAFGCDLDLFSFDTSKVVNLEIEGQLTDDGRGDIKLSEGMENLRQQLIIRLGTPKGSLLLHPDFGTHILDYIGKRVTKELLIKIKLEVQECLMGDFRVLGVDDVEVVFRDHGVFVECVVQPIEPYSVFKLSYVFSD